MNLPKKYNVTESTPEKYKKYEGVPKISYSQITSFKDYKEGYIQDYILGLGSGESGMFAEFGSAVGTYLSENQKDKRLSDSDIKILDSVERHKDGKYEIEIVIDRGDYCIQGFIDYEFKDVDGLSIDDYKTVNFKDRHTKYGDLNKYWQTRLYAYQRENEGEIIKSCGVKALGRKGNVRFEDVTESNKHNVLRLSGETDFIPTPYVRGEVEEYLKEIDKIAEEIAMYNTVYQKFLK